MANRKKLVNDSEVGNVSDAQRTVLGEVEVTNRGLVKERWQQIMDEIVAIRSDDFSKIDCYEKWNSAFEKYESIKKLIVQFSDDESVPERARAEAARSLFYALQQYYDDFYEHFLKWGLNHFRVAEDEAKKASEMVKATEDKAEKAQALNLTVFSIFITVITFLLSNVFVIGNVSDLDIKKVVIINLTLLFVASLLFLFVGFFLGFVGKGSNKLIAFIKNLILCLIPIAAIVALVLIGVNWE